MWNQVVHKASVLFCLLALLLTAVVVIEHASSTAGPGRSGFGERILSGAAGSSEAGFSSGQTGPSYKNAFDGISKQSMTDADGAVNVHLQNGISARILPASYLESRTIYNQSGGRIDMGDGRYMDVITNIEDPAIYNKGDGSFHPFDMNLVLGALGGIDLPGVKLDITVYLLPYPRKNILMSSSSSTEMFLSPHVMEVTGESASYIVAHETGHVFQYMYMPWASVLRWADYKNLRGISDETVFSSVSSHAYRPGEIFAEDFRVLFGGKQAASGGQVENPELPSPLYVAGLKDFFIDLAASPVAMLEIAGVSNYPNPFNPQTRVNVALSPDFIGRGEKVSVRIYDARGALIKELYSGLPDGSNVNVPWDGTNSRGEMVASSTYLCVVKAGRATATRKMMLIK